MALKSVVDGASLAAVKKQITECSKYKGIAVSKTEADEQSFTQMRIQFIQALVDNLKARFPKEKFLEAGACLSPTSWPDDENARAMYGDQQVVNLEKLCHVNAIEALNEFRDYKHNTRRLGETLQTLFQQVSLLPISSAEGERRFSCMNANDTTVENQLSIVVGFVIS